METQEQLVKEVFAQFGAAYYHSEVLHRGLCNIYALATFEKAEDITRPRIEEKLALAFSLTLGQIVEKTKGLFSGGIQQRLEVALDKRNYLAHRFWFERSPLMFSEPDLLGLRQELLELTNLFGELDEAITESLDPRRQAMGLTDELIQESFDKLIAGESDEPLISQRLLKKQERIVRAWDVKVGDNLVTQVFEHGRWVSLAVLRCWPRKERLEKPAPNGMQRKAARVSTLLTSTLDRPVTEPWNYEFRSCERVPCFAGEWQTRGIVKAILGASKHHPSHSRRPPNTRVPLDGCVRSCCGSREVRWHSRR